MIRVARESDVDAMASIIAHTPLWQRYGVTHSVAHAAMLSGIAGGDALRIAALDEEVTGLCWVKPQGGFGRSPYLKWMAVAPGFTGRGLGAPLLRAAEEAACVHCPELMLLCSDFNVAGQRFYEREGYARVGEIHGYALPGVRELIYFKRLAVALSKP